MAPPKTLFRDEDHDVVHDHTNTLGSLRLRNIETNEIILVPTPSSDPNDPLNWSTPFKWYTAILVCTAMVMCNFLAAGPTVAIVETALDFFPSAAVGSPVWAIQKTAYFFNCTALFQGLGNLIWMPLIVKYGRRPVYCFSFVLYTITAIWAAFAFEYSNFLVARIFMGLAAGAGECLAPLTISDLFFLHQRGTVMAAYNAALSMGVALGLIIDGLITIHYKWRVIYYVAIALIGFVTILVIFTFPESAFNRSAHPGGITTDMHHTSAVYAAEHPEDFHAKSDEEVSSIAYKETAEVRAHAPKRTWVQELKLFHGTFTKETWINLTFRPVMLLVLPPVLWATLVMSVTIGFIVAVTSNVSSAFATTYGFAAWQSGLVFVAAVIGCVAGIALGGVFSDWVADYLTKRNGGVREPEMRLPAMMISCVSGPLALVLYGVGIQYKLHWICPTIGVGLLNFTICQATNVSLVYTIDAYRPIAGEITVTQLAFKSCFGFLLGFYTNTWVAEDGYAPAYGEMGAISGAVLLMWIPLFIWGKRIRQATLAWGIMKFVRWDSDREVGE